MMEIKMRIWTIKNLKTLPGYLALISTFLNIHIL